MAQTLMIRATAGVIGAKIGGVRILRVRPTRHFLYLLVRCRCGKSFGHRADRRKIVCFSCGRMAELPLLRAKPLPKPAARREPRPKPRRPSGRALVVRPASRRARTPSKPR
ncbi:MAG TPA: hypothetical protein VN461_10310 [Vicinamibacteria bacterium]|nr:hypothetical protein [Vicinamibacteria bacterium]